MRFALLGPLRVQDGDHEIAIRAPMQRSLLAALLVEPGRTQEVDRLVDVLWAQGKSAGSRDALQMQMVRLRRAIGERIARRIVTRPDGYLFEVEEAELDLSQFLNLSELARRSAQAGHWDRALTLVRDSLDLWTGTPLQDVPSERLRNEYEPYLSELRISAIQLSIDAGLNLGHSETLIGELRELVRGHPFRERLVAQLMLALYRSGRQAEALLAYQDARSRLIEDLGVEPGPEVRALHQRILRGTEAMSDSDQRHNRLPPAQLPPRVRDFTGRDEQLQTLRELLASSHGPQVAAVIGAGGTGKTTLVVQAGHLHREHFPDGQLYAVMRGAGSQPVPAGDVLGRFLRDLGIGGSSIPDDPDERALLYRSLLAERRMLIVLDDARDAAQVRPLVPAGPGNAVLVTSRDRLAGLDAITRLHLDVLGAAESRELFRRIVGGSRAQAEPEATDSVLTVCAGLPLALRIAGARLAVQPSRTVSGLAGKLGDAARRLDALEAGDRGVRASFQVSYAELPPAGMRAFRLLGLWDGGTISAPAAVALVGETEADTEELTELLVEAHMLQELSPGSYQFHDLMRCFARERAEQEEREADRELALRRLLTWYLRTADAACALIEPQRSFSAAGIDDVGVAVTGLDFASRDDAIVWCDAERANLMAAVFMRARLSTDTPGWPLPLVLAHYYNLRGLWADWITTHEAGLAVADRAGDRYGRARLLLSLGRARTDLRDFDAAVASYEEAFTLLRELGAGKEALRALANLAALRADQGLWEKAFAAHTEALAMSRALGDERAEAVVLGNLGRTAVVLGRLDDGTRDLRQALAMRRKQDDVQGQGVVLHNLGEAYWRAGCVDEAVNHYQQALGLRRMAGYRLGEARTLCDLGRLHLDRRCNQSARECLTQALRIFEDLNAPEASEVRVLLSGIRANSQG